jgi:hypothetical protein
LAALLESAARPRYWTRSFRSTDYDSREVGWRFTALAHGREQSDSPRIYDATRRGYSNAGHTYGDVLEPVERRALLELLKTL